MRNKAILLILGLILISGLLINVDAQCAMCSMAAEQNLKQGGTDGRGLNKGIFLLLMLPYILIGFIGYQWYKNRNTENEPVV